MIPAGCRITLGMAIRTRVLLLWAVVATIAAVWLAMRPTPEVPPRRPAPDSGDLPRARSGATLEGFLAMAIEPPAPDTTDTRPVGERVADAFGKARSDRASRRKLFGLVAHDPEAHLALMEMLRTADDEMASDLLLYLVWNPFVKSTRRKTITEKIHAAAREMIAKDPSVARREAAVRVLFRYGRPGRAAFDYGMERLAVEPTVEIRDVLLDEMTVAGREVELTRGEAEPFVAHLRDRFAEGEAWCADAIARWSDDPEDFRRIREALATERDIGKRQELVNAFDGENALVRDRSAEGKAVLIGLLNDPAEHEDIRTLARSFLATSYGPMDEESARAVRRYDAERGRR
jgi:hypothetical protein